MLRGREPVNVIQLQQIVQPRCQSPLFPGVIQLASGTWMNCRMLLALVSTMDSIASSPLLFEDSDHHLYPLVHVRLRSFGAKRSIPISPNPREPSPPLSHASASLPGCQRTARSLVEEYAFMAVVSSHCAQNPAPGILSVMASRVQNRRSGGSLPVAVGVLSHDPPQSGLA
jgi:hypothetical protein